jgi:SAM-dependent methyltransferase
MIERKEELLQATPRSGIEELASERVNELYRLPELYDKAFSWDLKTEREFYGQLLTRYYPTGSKRLRVIEFGSGTGRILTMLTQLHHEAVGLELSREMAGFAKQNLQGTSIIQGDMTNCPVRSGTFDAALCTLSTFNYLKTPSSIVKHLESAFALLRPSGIYIIDFTLGTPPKRLEEWDSKANGETLVVK